MRSFYLVTLFIAASFFAYAQSSEVGHTSLTLYSTEELQEDFKIFKRSLEAYHPGLYWYSSQDEMNDFFNEFQRSISKPMTARQFRVKLSEVIQKVGCGHVFMMAPKNLELNRENDLPLTLFLDGNKAFCLKNNSNNPESLFPGSEILSINQISIDSIINLFSTQLKEGSTQAWGRFKAQKHFNHFYAALIGNSEQYNVSFRDENDIVKSVTLGSSEQFYNSTSSDEGYINLTINDSLSTAVLRIKSFMPSWKENGKKMKSDKVIDQSMKEIITQAENLVIDLRGNSGGKAPLKLFSYLYDSSFIFFKQFEFKARKGFEYVDYFHPNPDKMWVTSKRAKEKIINDSLFQLIKTPMRKPYAPSKSRFQGDLFFIIDGGCFSATSDFMAMVKSHNLGTIIGTETGGGYYGNTSADHSQLTLPNSHIRITIPMVRHLMNVKGDVELGRGVQPDHFVPSNIEDQVSGVDTQLEYTLNLIRELKGK